MRDSGGVGEVTEWLMKKHWKEVDKVVEYLEIKEFIR